MTATPPPHQPYGQVPYVPGHQPPPLPPPMYGQVIPPPKKSKLPWIIGGGAAALLVLCVSGGVIAALSSGSEPEPNRAAAPLVAPSNTGPYYGDCAAVQAAGKDLLRVGQPGYRIALDANQDGIACNETLEAVPTSAAPAAPVPATEAAPAGPTFVKDVTLSGRGDKVAKLKLVADTAYMAVISHTGGSNFAIWTIDEFGDEMDLLVNEIGRYTGVKPVALMVGEDPRALKITADGTWRIVLKDIGKAPKFTGKVSGKGSALFLVPDGTFGGLTTLKLTHKGSSNFVVHGYGEDNELLVNEIGRYNGEVLADASTDLIEIEADGAWTMTTG